MFSQITSKMIVRSLLCLTVLYSVIEGLGMPQGYAVKGRLFCGAFVASNTEVKLVSKDADDSDEALDSKMTDANGFFRLQGGLTDDLSSLEPQLKIYHKCDTQYGQRVWIMDLPQKYVKLGNGQPKVVDIGVYNLEVKPHDEM